MAYADVPTSYGTDRIADWCFTSARIIGLGDSWWDLVNSRLSRAFTTVWPDSPGVLSAAYLTPKHDAAACLSLMVTTSGASEVSGGDEAIYEADGQSDYALFGTQFAAVNGLIQVWDDRVGSGLANGTSDRIQQFALVQGNLVDFSSAGIGTTSRSLAITRHDGEQLGVRYVYLSPDVASAQLGTFSCSSGSNNLVAYSGNMATTTRPRMADGADPFSVDTAAIAVTEPLRLHAAPYDRSDTTFTTLHGDYQVTNLTDGLSGDATTVRLFADIAGQNKALALHGVVIYRAVNRQWTGGVYFNPLVQDESWDYSSLWLNEPSDSSRPKKYSDDQVRDLIDLTTIDRDQPTLIVPYFATEDATLAYYQSGFASFMARYDSIFASLGLPKPYYLMLGNPYHLITNRTYAQSKPRVQDQNEAAYLAAKAHPRAAFVSQARMMNDLAWLPDATTGETGNLAAVQAWVGGTKWGSWRDHPSRQTIDMAAKTSLWDAVAAIHPVDLVSAEFMLDIVRDAIKFPDQYGGELAGNVSSANVLRRRGR